VPDLELQRKIKKGEKGSKSRRGSRSLIKEVTISIVDLDEEAKDPK